MMPAIFGKVEYKYMTNNMTTGKPAKLILQFMIPTCLGNIFQQFYNLVHTMIVGKLSFNTILIPSPGVTLGAAAISVALGIIFGMYPAIKASGLQPVVALRAD